MSENKEEEIRAYLKNGWKINIDESEPSIYDSCMLTAPSGSVYKATLLFGGHGDDGFDNYFDDDELLREAEYARQLCELVVHYDGDLSKIRYF